MSQQQRGAGVLEVVEPYSRQSGGLETTFDEVHNYFRNAGSMPLAERRSLFMSRWRELISHVSAA